VKRSIQDRHAKKVRRIGSKERQERERKEE
jgi:hypothetical protein